MFNDDELEPLSGPHTAADTFSKQLSEANDAVDLLKDARTVTSASSFAPVVKESPAAAMTYSTDASDDESPAPLALVQGRLSDATSSPETSRPSLTIDSGPKTRPASADPLDNDILHDFGPPEVQKPRKKGSSVLDIEDYAATHVQEEDVLPLADAHIDEMLHMCQQMGGSDLHLTAGLPPMIRKDGKVIPLKYEILGDRDSQRLVYDVLNNEQMTKFEQTKELDFSYGVKNLGRYRFNVYRQRGSVGCAMRVIPQSVPTIDELRLPPILRDLVRRHAGLILVTGPTGSGKSTTIASLIDIINTERQCHIMTIEDPIEYLHRHKKAMINQRELGTDTNSFDNALRAVLREDPDVILVGEMRDLETISAAITLAETGHLVFATLHTRSAPTTVDRIVDVFPSHQQQQIRIQLSTSIEAVVAQQLLPRLGGGRVAAIEIMVATSAIRNLIREGKTHQIMSVIETGHQYGMQAMDRVLADLHRNSAISYEEASTHAIDRENFTNLVKNR